MKKRLQAGISAFRAVCGSRAAKHISTIVNYFSLDDQRKFQFVGKAKIIILSQDNVVHLQNEISKILAD